MIHSSYGNLFDKYSLSVNSDHLHIIVHGCNAQGRMGSGFAKELRERYPAAYEEYKKVHETEGLKLGSTVYYLANQNLLIANAITQEFYGYDGEKYVSYDAIDTVFKDMNDFIAETGRCTNLHFPKIGADLGGGCWDVISEIIDHRITNASKHLYILK
jgi:Predicted phosphatase homologous to the C-terminal domain of histone macroH2A1